MGVPATLADLDPIAANNSPSGSDPIGTNLDDYLRSHAALIKQSYSDAVALAVAIIPSGTRMPFAQASAPTGWTQAVTDNEDNRMLRVVNTMGGGGGAGGSHSPILNTVVPAHTHTFTTGAESATHTHNDNGHTHGISSGADGSRGNAGSGVPLYGGGTSSVGYASLSAETALHTHSGTTVANPGAANWMPRYIDMIICAKN